MYICNNFLLFLVLAYFAHNIFLKKIIHCFQPFQIQPCSEVRSVRRASAGPQTYLACLRTQTNYKCNQFYQAKVIKFVATHSPPSSGLKVTCRQQLGHNKMKNITKIQVFVVNILFTKLYQSHHHFCNVSDAKLLEGFYHFHLM